MNNETVSIENMREGNEFIGFYALKRCDLREYDGGFRLDIELSDRTGSIAGVIWDNAPELKEQLDKGDVVKAMGRVGSYRDKPQARIDKIRRAETGEYKTDAFLPSTPKDIDTLKARVAELVESITDPHLSELSRHVFHDEKIMTEYAKSPGGMQWHHPYIGGLLEHSVGVAGICDYMAEQHPELNRDLLLVAALLHDIGKIREYTASTVIDFSDEGRLVGHIVMGERFVRTMCDRIDGFPPTLRMLLSHLMLAHQGHREFSSPVEPMIPEGFVLYYADEMDSKLNAIGRIVERTKDENKSWSEYVRTIGRYIFAEDYYGGDGSNMDG